MDACGHAESLCWSNANYRLQLCYVYPDYPLSPSPTLIFQILDLRLIFKIQKSNSVLKGFEDRKYCLLWSPECSVICSPTLPHNIHSCSRWSLSRLSHNCIQQLEKCIATVPSSNLYLTILLFRQTNFTSLLHCRPLPAGPGDSQKTNFETQLSLSAQD